MFKTVYHDPSSPGSFGGINKLCSAVKQSIDIAPHREQVKEWLFKQDAYTLLANAAKHFPRTIVVYDINNFLEN